MGECGTGQKLTLRPGRMVSGEVMACHVARAAKIVPFLHSTEGKGNVVAVAFTELTGQTKLKVSLEST